MLKERKVLLQFQSHFDCSVFARKFRELCLVTLGDGAVFHSIILREKQLLVKDMSITVLCQAQELPLHQGLSICL